MATTSPFSPLISYASRSPLFPTSNRTQDYLDFQLQSDTNDDGKLTREEAKSRIKTLDEQIGTLTSLCFLFRAFSPQTRQYLNRVLSRLDVQSRAGNRLLAHFDTFSHGGPKDRKGDDPNTVSIRDIRILSARDRNPAEISRRDLFPPYTPPPPPSPAPQ